MASNPADALRDVRHEPDENPPKLLSLGLGLQYAMIAVPGIVPGPTVAPWIDRKSMARCRRHDVAAAPAALRVVGAPLTSARTPTW